MLIFLNEAGQEQTLTGPIFRDTYGATFLTQQGEISEYVYQFKEGFIFGGLRKISIILFGHLHVAYEELGFVSHLELEGVRLVMKKNKAYHF